MNKSWISIQLEMADFPYYDYKSDSNNETDPQKKKNWLDRYKNRYNK